jgi:hypothetical protein
MHKLTFFPIGNADCCRIDLSGGQKLLFDYADMRDPNDEGDLRIDLAAAICEDLGAAKRNSFDVVTFSHLDEDHIRGASEIFYLQHAKKYQSDERIGIDTLWVPAAAIIEEGCEDEDRIIRAEARYRLKQGSGIRVFSRPVQLKQWLENEGISFEERKHLITDAGQTIPGFTLADDGVEFFAHSPFASRLNDGSMLDRNTDAIAIHATFLADGKITKFLMLSDLDHTAISDIVGITQAKQRNERLEWDVMKLGHHCSYTSLGPDKGKDKTEPVLNVKWLYEEASQAKAILVSPSNVIPENDDDKQPPHRQAANYYKERAAARNGEFIVTMAHPKATAPEELVIEIGGSKAKVKRGYLGGAAVIVSHPAPRAGAHGR